MQLSARDECTRSSMLRYMYSISQLMDECLSVLEECLSVLDECNLVLGMNVVQC